MTDTTNADTSATEDLGAFEAEFYGSEPEKQPEPAPAEPAEPEPAPAAEGEEGGEGEPPPADEARKPKKTTQQRIDELTWRANEAERREKATADELAALKAGKDAPAPEQRQAAADEAPDPDNYEFGEEDAAFIRDQAKFEARQEFLAERQHEDQQRTITQARNDFEAKAKAAFPDGEPEGLKAYRTTQHNSPLLNEVVMTSENGPQVAAYYGENKDALQRLSAMSPHMQAYEIAKVEARLTASSETANPQPKPKTVTDAPEPAPRVRGAGGQFSVQGDTDDQEAFEREFYRRT